MGIASAAVLFGAVGHAQLLARAPETRTPEYRSQYRLGRAGLRLGGSVGGAKIGGDTLLLALVGGAAGTSALVLALNSGDHAASPGS